MFCWQFWVGSVTCYLFSAAVMDYNISNTYTLIYKNQCFWGYCFVLPIKFINFLNLIVTPHGLMQLVPKRLVMIQSHLNRNVNCGQFPAMKTPYHMIEPVHWLWRFYLICFQMKRKQNIFFNSFVYCTGTGNKRRDMYVCIQTWCQIRLLWKDWC